MTTLTISTEQLHSLASLTNLIDKKTNAPVLLGIHLTITDGTAIAYVTDRYYAGRLEFSVVESDNGTILVPATILSEFSKLAKKVHRDVPVTITQESDTAPVIVANGHGEQLVIGRIDGTYPPLERLFFTGDDKPAGIEQVSLNIKLLARLTKLHLVGDMPQDNYTLQFFGTKENYSKKVVPNPLQAVLSNDKSTLTLLIQPVLNVR